MKRAAAMVGVWVRQSMAEIGVKVRQSDYAVAQSCQCPQGESGVRLLTTNLTRWGGLL